MSNEFPFEIWVSETPGYPAIRYSQHRTKVAAERGLDALRIGYPHIEYEIRGAQVRTNIDDALEIVHEIDRVRAVIRELKAAFARSELDGGVKAARRHPLYIQCEQHLEVLHEQLMMVI